MGLTGRVTNELVTWLPGIESVQYLRLANNDVVPWDAPQFTRFVKERCAAPGRRCSGLPYAGSGFSCTAFGFMARLKLDVPNECDKCDGDQTGTILLILLMVVLMVIGLTAYVIIILKFPEALRRWVSFAIILVNHTQTLSILGSLNLTWPPIVKIILSALTLFQIESATCLLPPNVPSFWLYAFGVLSLSLLLLGTVTLAMVYYDKHGRSRVADRLEFALTVLFSTLFVYTLQVCSSVLRENVYGGIYLAHIAAALAVPVLLLICALAWRFWHKVAAYRRAVDGRGWNEGGWCTSRGLRVYPRSLRQRVFYLTHRFGMHAQRWQFVVWARQLALIILIAVNELIAYHFPVQVKYTRYASTFVAVIIIFVALRWHVKVAPYAYKSQNALESFLMICNLLLLTTVCIYQTLADIERGLFLPASEATFNVSDYPTLAESSYLAELRADEVDALVEPPFMGHQLPIFVVTEILMVVFLGVSFLSTALYVAYDVRAKRRAVEGTDPNLVLTAADMYFDGPIKTALRHGRLRLISCDWMLSAKGGGALVSIRAPDGSGWPLPDEAYLPPEKAVQVLGRGDRSVFMLSYVWGTLLSPDPKLRTLRTVRAYLQRQSASGCGLYWDVFSLQESNMQQNIVNDVISDTDLSQLLCASVTSTAILCVKRPVARLPLDLEGHVLVYDYAQHVSDKALMIARKHTEVEDDEVATFSEADKSAPERKRREARPKVISDATPPHLPMPESSNLPPPVRLCVSAPIDMPPEDSADEPEEVVFLTMPCGPLNASKQSVKFREPYRANLQGAISPGGSQPLPMAMPQPNNLPPPGPLPKVANNTYRQKLAVKMAAIRADKAAVLMEATATPEEGVAAAGDMLTSAPSMAQSPQTETHVPSKVKRIPRLMNPPGASTSISTGHLRIGNGVAADNIDGFDDKLDFNPVEAMHEAEGPSSPPPSPPHASPPRKRLGLDPMKSARKADKAASKAVEEEKRAKQRAEEQALRTKLSEYGMVISCSIVGAHAHVRFASHESALKAVADPKLACDLVHLDKPFNERGRCIAEEGIAQVAIAHLKKAEEIGQLPSRFILAQARRPKLVYVGEDGDAQKCEWGLRPDMALASMRHELEATSVHFRGKDERDDVLMGVAQMEYLIDRSMDEATQLQQLDRFTISPALVEQLRLISSIEVRPPKGTCPVICIRSPCKSGALITFSGGYDGVHVGAVIVAINGVVVSGQASVVKQIISQCYKSGAAELTLARRTWCDKVDRGLDSASLGISICASPRGIGALVCKVRPGSLAEKHDVRQGDTILSVNETIGESAEQVLELIQSDRVVKLVLERFTKDLSFLKAHLRSFSKGSFSKSEEGSFTKSEQGSFTKSEGSFVKSESGSFIKSESSPQNSDDDDLEAQSLAAGRDDEVITLDGVVKHRQKRASRKPSATKKKPKVKRANFLLHVQVGVYHSPYVNNELSAKQLAMPCSLLVRWALNFFKEGRGASGPFAPLAGFDIEQLVKENDQIRVFADSTEVPDMTEVQLITLVQSEYKPVRIDIEVVHHVERRKEPVHNQPPLAGNLLKEEEVERRDEEHVPTHPPQLAAMPLKVGDVTGPFVPRLTLQTTPHVIKLEGMLTQAMLDADDMYAEVLDDIKTECEDSGPVVRVVMPRSGPYAKLCYVVFSEATAAAKARASLDQSEFEGNLVTATFIEAANVPSEAWSEAALPSDHGDDVLQFV